jgi:heterodisulfide reductase subunit B
LQEYSKKQAKNNQLMKIGIYPGCSLTGSARDYNESVFALAEAFELDFAEIPDWNCCGATAAHNLNKELSLALPARILALAEQNGLREIVVPCAACYSRLVVTQHELKRIRS